MVPSLRFNAERAAPAAAGGGYLLATDVADYLVAQGRALPRGARRRRRARPLRRVAEQTAGGLTLEEYRRFSPEFQEDILALDITSSMARA